MRFVGTCVLLFIGVAATIFVSCLGQSTEVDLWLIRPAMYGGMGDFAVVGANGVRPDAFEMGIADRRAAFKMRAALDTEVKIYVNLNRDFPAKNEELSVTVKHAGQVILLPVAEPTFHTQYPTATHPVWARLPEGTCVGARAVWVRTLLFDGTVGPVLAPNSSCEVSLGRFGQGLHTLVVFRENTLVGAYAVTRKSESPSNPVLSKLGQK